MEEGGAVAFWADTFRPANDMHSAITQSTTTNITGNVRRFIDCPFRELSFGVETQGGALNTAQQIWIPSRPPLVIRCWPRRGTKPTFLAAKMDGSLSHSERNP